MHTLGGIIEYQQSWNLRTPGGGERTQAAPPQLTHNLPHTNQPYLRTLPTLPTLHNEITTNPPPSLPQP